MEMKNIPFGNQRIGENCPDPKHKGETGMATGDAGIWRAFRVAYGEYSAGYLADPLVFKRFTSCYVLKGNCLTETCPMAGSLS